MLCESVEKKEKAAEEGGTRLWGRIQLELSGTSGLCLIITRHPCDKSHAFNDLCDNQSLLKAVKTWVGEGGKATLVGAPDANFLLEAIEEIRKRTTAEQRRFWSKWKRIEENLQMKEPTS